MYEFKTVFGSRFLQMSHVQKSKVILSISGTDVSPPYPKSRTRANSRVQRLWGNTCSTCLDVVLTLLGRETGINGFGMYPTGNCIILKLTANICCQDEGPFQPILTSPDRETLRLAKNILRRHYILQRKYSYSHITEIFPICLGKLMQLKCL